MFPANRNAKKNQEVRSPARYLGGYVLTYSEVALTLNDYTVGSLMPCLS